MTILAMLFVWNATSAAAEPPAPKRASVGSEKDLVARYAFDEGQGTVARDSSGNGHDGKLCGNAKYVKRDGGYALQFSATTDNVDLGNSPALTFKGDMTIEAWVKGANTKMDDQIIIGSLTDLAVTRNFYMHNSKGRLKFEHGNGTANEILSIDDAIFDGEWHHVAFVAEYPDYYFFINGKLAKHGQMGFPISPTPGPGRVIGGWAPGYFDGQLDDVRLYKRALSEKEIAGHAGTSASLNPVITVSARALWLENAAKIEVRADGLATPKAVARISFTLPGSLKPVAQDVALSETRPGSGRGQAVIKAPGLAKGEYQITAELLGQKDAVLARAEQRWQCPGIPAWLNSKAGVTDVVLPPYTPVDVKKQMGEGDRIRSLDVAVWGRVYHFENAIFPAQVTTNGKQILAEPIKLTARITGNEVSFRDCRLAVESSAPHLAVVTVSSEAAGLLVTARHQIEYDGMVRTDWKLESKNAGTLGRLTLEIPFVAENAKYLYDNNTLFWGAHDPSWKTGAIEEGSHNSGFSPFVWLGDDERGMEWACESAHDWFNKDATKAITVIKEGGKVTLRLSLVDRPIFVGPNKGLSYTFALQASPVKPIERDSWDSRINAGSLVDYGKDYTLLTKKVGDESALDYLQKSGVRAIMVLNWTDIMVYASPVGHEEDLRNLVKECHKRGIKVIPYFGYQISELAPEWPDFQTDVVKLPEQANPDRYPGMEPQMMHIVCLRSLWKDFLTYSIAKLMDDYDIDGVYMDTTIHPYPCQNGEHGCGNVDREGTLHATVPLFDVRETIKRIYAIVKSRKPDGIVDLHVWDSMNLPSLAWGTSYWTGEQVTPYGGVVKNFADKLPLDRFRTEFMGWQWGVPAEFLRHPLGLSFKDTFAVTLPHGVMVRPLLENKDSLDLLSSMWKAGEQFGRKEATWRPYWKNAEYVSASPQEIYVSLYQHPKNGVLAIVSNLAADAQKVEVKFNLEKLGLSGKPLSATDALTGQSIAIDTGKIALDLPKLGWTVVWLK